MTTSDYIADDAHDYRNIEDITTVGWQFFTPAGVPGRKSRVHLTADRGETTLCHLPVPSAGQADIDAGYGDRCLRCQDIARKLSQEAR